MRRRFDLFYFLDLASTISFAESTDRQPRPGHNSGNMSSLAAMFTTSTSTAGPSCRPTPTQITDDERMHIVKMRQAVPGAHDWCEGRLLRWLHEYQVR